MQILNSKQRVSVNRHLTREDYTERSEMEKVLKTQTVWTSLRKWWCLAEGKKSWHICNNSTKGWVRKRALKYSGVPQETEIIERQILALYKK